MNKEKDYKDYMPDYDMDEEYPMYPQPPMMGMPPAGCPMMPAQPMPCPPIGMPPCQPPMGMPPMGMHPMPHPPMHDMMPGMDMCPPMIPGGEDLRDLCCMEHMNEYMAYIHKAEACRCRAMQCMKQY